MTEAYACFNFQPYACCSNAVVRVHKVISRKGRYWKSGEKIKILKGADGLPKNNLYATLEYIVLEGFEGDAGSE